MSDAIDFFREAWSYKVSLLPVLVTYLLFDAQAIYRRATKTLYVPIYFIVFPSGHSDKLYAEYFSEDDLYGAGDMMTDNEKKLLRHKIIISAIVSMILATIVAPYLCGMVSALYLTHQQFTEFVVTLLVVKSAFIIYALHKIRTTSRVVNQGPPFCYVVLIYIAYLYFVWRGLTKSFDWASMHLAETGPWGFMSALGDLAHEEFFINILAVTLLTWVVQQRLTTPENISPLSEYVEGSEPAVPTTNTRAN